MRPDANLGADNLQERERLFDEIRMLSAELARFGFHVPNLKNTARTMAIHRTDGKEALSIKMLETSRAELIAALRMVQGKNRVREGQVVNLRWATIVAAFTAFIGGATIQKIFGEEESKPTEVTKTSPSIVPPVPPPSPPSQENPAAQLHPIPQSPAPQQNPAMAHEPRQPRPAQTRVKKSALRDPEPEGRSAQTIANLTDTNFESLTSRGIWVVDFYADWCGPCQEIKPIFEKTFRSYRNQGIRFGRCTGEKSVD